ncbi:hypothetical protein ACROYT_G042675 [Oculina patagonica]
MESSARFEIEGGKPSTGRRLTDKEYRPSKSTEKYVPRLHGFKIHPSAYTLPVQEKHTRVPAYPTRMSVTSQKTAKESLL